MAYTLMVGVGAQKAGTTWLYNYLSRHPQCAMSRIKEMHFWNERFLPGDDALARRYYGNWLMRISSRIKEGFTPSAGSVDVAKDLIERAGMVGDPTAYRRYFDSRVGEARVTGEISPAYSRLSIEHFREMRTCHPDLRPIFVLRDPVDRFWAAMRSIAQNEKRSADAALIAERLSKPAHLERGAYHRTALNLEDVFGRDGVLLLYYEDLFTDPGIERVCDFLGLDRQPADFRTRINAGGGSEFLRQSDAAAIFHAHRDTYDWAASRDAPLPQRWRDRLEAFG